MKLATWWTKTLGPMLLLAGGAVWAQPLAVAVVSDLHGEAQLARAGGTAPLRLLSELRPGDTVRLDAGSKAVVAFLPGGEVYEVSGAGRFLVRGKGLEAADARNPPRRRELPASLKQLGVKANDVSQGAVVMRGGGAVERVVLVRPSHAISARGQLVFEWKPIATPVYRFLLVDDQGNKVHEADVDGARYVLPEAVHLDEGRPYVWAVSARNQRGVTTESAAEFTLLPAAQRSALEAARPSPGAELTERVVYGLALEQRGLQDEAQRYWAELAAERPALGTRVRGR